MKSLEGDACRTVAKRRGDGRIYARHVGETDSSVFESEIKELLARPAAGM